MGNRALIYCRVSTAKQAAEELPIESQLRACEEKAAALGLNVEKIFLDEGYSASSDRRPAFQDAIVYAEVFQIDYFVTWSSSRFARNKRDAAYYKDRLDQIGTKLIYVSMDIDTSTTGGWMLDGFMELFDEYFSRQVSSDTKRSMMRNARAGYWNGGRAPYGFEPLPAPENPKRRKLAPVESEANVVNMIFRMKSEQHLGARSIMRKLNEQGITNRGRPWALNTLRDLLKNHALIGKTVFGKRPRGKRRVIKPRDEWIIIDSHPAIVDEKLFYQVQEQLEQETPMPSADTSKHLIVGIAYCRECGARMHIESSTGRSNTYYYYYCRSAKLDQTHHYQRYRADLVDDQLKRIIQTRILTIKTLNQISAELIDTKNSWRDESDSLITQHENELTNLERKNKNIMAVVEQLGTAAANISEMVESLKSNSLAIERHRMEIRKLQCADVNDIDFTISAHELRASLMRIISSDANTDQVRAFLQTVIKRIELDDEKIVLDYAPSQLFASAVRHTDGWLPGPNIARTKKIEFPMPELKRRAG